MTPATRALDSADVAYTVHTYEHDPASTAYGTEAAQALDISDDEMFKTLIASADGTLVVAVVPVNCTVNLKRLAGAVGKKHAEMASPADAQRSSGYVVGGISPLGQRKRLATVIDESVLLWDRIYVSGGRRWLSLELAPADLITATGAIVADIAR